MRDPYYLIPDGDVGQEAFAVIREAIKKEGLVALGREAHRRHEGRDTLSPTNSRTITNKR